MRGMRPSSHRVANHVYHPVLSLAQTDECVERPRCCPHNVRTSLVVLRILYSLARSHNETTHQTLGEIIARVVVEIRKVLLHDVVHDVIDARLHLVVRHSHRELRIQD